MFLFLILISTILCNSSSLSSKCISSPLYIYNNNNSLINLNFLPNTSITSFSSISFKYIPNETKLTFNNSFTQIHIDTIYPLLTNLFFFQINSFNFNSAPIIYNLHPNKTITSNDDLSISCRLDIIILYCYISCSTCINNEIGNENDNKCISCNEGYSFIENKPHQCIQSNSNDYKLTNYFHHLGTNTYYECNPSNVDIYYKCLNCKKDNLYFYNNKCNSFNGSLIVANHPTLLDYVILTSKLSVNTCSMVKRKLLDTFMRPIIKHLDYVNNEDSIELITNKTDQGEDILIFPEGTRTKDFNNVSFVRGVANLACRKGLKVVCLHIYCDDQGYLNRGFYSFKAPSKIPTYYIEYIDTLDSKYFVENESRLPIAARKFNEHLEKFYNDCYIRVKGNYERK